MRTARAEMLHRLGLATSWMSRTELTCNLPFGETVLDNELADLVMAEQVMFNPRTREYRLAGTPVARQALRELLAVPDLPRMVVGREVPARHAGEPRMYRVGIAERRADAAGRPMTVMAEVELPYPGMNELIKLQQSWVTK